MFLKVVLFCSHRRGRIYGQVQLKFYFLNKGQTMGFSNEVKLFFDIPISFLVMNANVRLKSTYAVLSVHQCKNPRTKIPNYSQPCRYFIMIDKCHFISGRPLITWACFWQFLTNPPPPGHESNHEHSSIPWSLITTWAYSNFCPEKLPRNNQEI